MRGEALALALAVLTVTPVVGSLTTFFEEDDWSVPLEMADAGTTLGGDPLTDEEASVHVEAGDRRASVHLKRTPAGLVDALPRSGEAREASPLARGDAELRLSAGPVVLEGPGEVSPAYPLDARLHLEGEDVDRAWLRLDGQRVAEFESAGTSDSATVYLGGLDAGVLPEGDVHVDAVAERRPTPATTQRLQGPGWDVTVDADPPPAPTVEVSDGEVELEGSAERFQAQARSEDGDWRPVPTEEATELRARAVDGAGNRGPWTVVELPAEGTATAGAGGEEWRLLSPSEGASLEGPARVTWEGPGHIEVQARPGPAANWQRVGEASTPPVTWQTAFVPDGDWQLLVRAHADGETTSRLVDVTVDNLDETSVEAAQRGEAEAGAPTAVGPRTASPLPAAMASAAALLALVGGAWQAWTGRPK